MATRTSEDDPGTPVATYEVIQQQIAGSKLIVVSGARYFSNVEQQGAFTGAITGILAEQV